MRPSQEEETKRPIVPHPIIYRFLALGLSCMYIAVHQRLPQTVRFLSRLLTQLAPP